MSINNELHVSAGILIDNHHCFLIARKKEGSPNAGLWEFPGGKIESDELPADALIRELNEELGVYINIKKELGVFYYQTTSHTLVLHSFICKCNEPIISSTDHDTLRWITLNESSQYTFLKADLLILEALGRKKGLY
jgi:8-oxo-dGTP diphosphatase